MVCCDALACDIFWHRVNWYTVSRSTAYLSVRVEQMSFITDHCGCVFPLFSLSPCTVLLNDSLTDGQARCVFFI